jgi:hypothetical protein
MTMTPAAHLRRTLQQLSWSLAAVGLAATGCSKEHTNTHPKTLTEKGPIAAGLSCNPIAEEWDCMYPYPSNFYLAPDDSLPGKVRVEMPDKALPLQHNDRVLLRDAPKPINYVKLHPTDGFSVLPQIGVLIPKSVDLSAPNIISNFVAFERFGETLNVAHPTLLVDAETGERIPHFVELDPRPESVDQRALLIRPQIRLQEGRRYIVVLKDLKHPDGSAIAAPDGFRRIRDRVFEDDKPVLARATDYYDDQIFPVLEKIGVARSSLILAWDFTTYTYERTFRDMLDMREDLMKTLDATPPPMTVAELRENPDGAEGPTAYRITGTFTVPSYMETNDPGALLFRGPDGRVRSNGNFTADFMIVVPKSVLNAAPTDPPARVVQFGHGFFGGLGEVSGGYVSRFASETKSIVVATVWTGMSTADAAALIGDLILDPSNAMRFTDRTHQGMMNFIGLNYAARTTLKDITFKTKAGATIYPLRHEQKADGAPIFDPQHLYYYGISQGCILGTTYLALAPAIERATCSVGGASFGFMMSRASPFKTYLDALENAQTPSADFQAAYPTDSAEILKKVKAGSVRIELLMQTSIDRIDPIAYLIHQTKNPLPGSPAKKIALQIGIGDGEVPNLASHVMARSQGFPQLAPGNRKLYEIPEKTGPIDGSALIEWDFGLKDVGIEAKPSDDNEAHEGVRREAAAIQQIDAFFRPDGKIEQFCPGADSGQPCKRVRPE